MRDKKILVALMLLLSAASGYGQTILPPNDLHTNAAADSERIKQENALRTSESSPAPFSSMIEVRPDEKLKYARKSEAYFLGSEMSRLLPSAEYADKYAEALKDKKMGLARLHPDKNCIGSGTTSVENAARCAGVLPIIGDGSYYSFRLKTNINQQPSKATGAILKADRADVQYSAGKLLAGGDFVQGLIAEVGGLDFDALNKNSPEIALLKEYKPEIQPAEAKKQKELLKAGITLDGFKYSDAAPAKIGATYILRSIAYRLYSPGQIFSRDQMIMVRRSVDVFDLRADMIVAFKTIGQEKDGSLIILWKELSQKDAPTLKGLFR